MPVLTRPSSEAEVMSTLTFYRQERFDGAIRTGLEYDGMTILEHFKPGKGEPDSVLRWFVDIRCEGKLLPIRRPEQARDFMLALKDTIVPALKRTAEELASTGIDQFQPLSREIPSTASGQKITLVVSAVMRLDAQQIAAKLLELARRWEELLQSLKPFAEAV